MKTTVSSQPTATSSTASSMSLMFSPIATIVRTNSSTNSSPACWKAVDHLVQRLAELARRADQVVATPGRDVRPSRSRVRSG